MGALHAAPVPGVADLEPVHLGRDVVVTGAAQHESGFIEHRERHPIRRRQGLGDVAGLLPGLRSAGHSQRPQLTVGGGVRQPCGMPQLERNQPDAPPGQADRLPLETPAGAIDAVDAATLVDRISGAARKPHLVFLAACSSGQRSASHPATATQKVAGDAFAALGTRRHAAGVPAVIAMREAVAMEVARRLAADFFAALFDPMHADGAVDLALNRARRLLYDRSTPVWAPPVLFCRLQDGALYTPPPRAAELTAPPAPVPTPIPEPKTRRLVGR